MKKNTLRFLALLVVASLTMPFLTSCSSGGGSSYYRGPSMYGGMGYYDGFYRPHYGYGYPPTIVVPPGPDIPDLPVAMPLPMDMGMDMPMIDDF